jgi:hypothetical protein
MYSILLTEIFAQTLQIISTKINGSEAEETSLYHNLSYWKFPSFLWLRAIDVQGILFAISFMGLPDDQQNSFREKAHRISEKHNFEGGWSLVEEFLQLNNNAPGKIISWYLEKHSPEDWFGDCLRRTIKIIKSGKSYNPYLPYKGTVNYPERKRGYNDKGSLSRPDKLGKEYYVRPDKEKTLLTELNKTSFYADWYHKEESLNAESKIGKSHFSEGGESK